MPLSIPLQEFSTTLSPYTIYVDVTSLIFCKVALDIVRNTVWKKIISNSSSQCQVELKCT